MSDTMRLPGVETANETAMKALPVAVATAAMVKAKVSSCVLSASLPAEAPPKGLIDPPDTSQLVAIITAIDCDFDLRSLSI